MSWNALKDETESVEVAEPIFLTDIVPTIRGSGALDVDDLIGNPFGESQKAALQLAMSQWQVRLLMASSSGSLVFLANRLNQLAKQLESSRGTRPTPLHSTIDAGAGYVDASALHGGYFAFTVGTSSLSSESANSQLRANEALWSLTAALTTSVAASYEPPRMGLRNVREVAVVVEDRHRLRLRPFSADETAPE